MSVGVLVPTTGQWTEVAGYAALADELGYDSINCSHIRARDSFTTLAALASVAPRVWLATAVDGPNRGDRGRPFRWTLSVGFGNRPSNHHGEVAWRRDRPTVG
jgi:hypothetical protein